MKPSLRLRRADIVAVAAIVYLGVALTVHWAPRTIWTPDALFYQAKVLEIQGASREDALDEVWQGPLAQAFRTADAQRPPELQKLADPEWIPFTAEIFERRLVVPTLAAIVDPVAGEESLEVVSVLGVFAFALALYALLRTRFGPAPSAIAVSICLLWPPMIWAFYPLTESWGLAFATLALLAAVMAIDRGSSRWMWIWAGTIFALSLTREMAPVPILGALAVALVLRTPQARLLAASGIAAALPVPLLVGSFGLKEHLLYGMGASFIPQDPSWGDVINQYPGALEESIRSSFDYAFSVRPIYLEEAWPVWPLAIVLFAGLVAVLLMRSPGPRDPFVPLIRGALVGGLVYVAITPWFAHLRYHLVLLPVAAVGLAFLVEWVGSWATRPAEPRAG